MSAYYNEFDPFAAAWLRELIKDGLIADGEVDERSITEVEPEDLRGFAQCHFFAGIGGWSLAARLAGWADDRPMWSGSPPCQPFSVAGNRKGKDDLRHLWPVFFNLIRECRPPAIFGEQVASAIRHGWFCDLQTDLEAEGYASAMAVLPACGVNAPHKRDRLFYVAQRVGDTQRDGRIKRTSEGRSEREGSASSEGRDEVRDNTGDRGAVCTVGNTEQQRLEGHTGADNGQGSGPQTVRSSSETGFWDSAEYAYCRDEKYRPIPTEPALFPLANGSAYWLEQLHAIKQKVLEVIDEFSANETSTGQAMSMVWDNIQSETDWEASGIGMLFQLHEKEILLDFLRDVLSARKSINDGGSIEKEGKQVNRIAVRMLRDYRGFDRAPYRLRPVEQLDGEHPNSVQEMSLFLARAAQAFGFAAREANAAANRVGILRGAGNAIVPQAAAEIIKAVM